MHCYYKETPKENVAATDVKLTVDELTKIRQLLMKMGKSHSGPNYSSQIRKSSRIGCIMNTFIVHR